jgi:hypothetical protein
VRQVGEVAGALELNRKEERRRDVDALDVSMQGRCAAGGDLFDPEGEARRVRLAVEEVEVVLADEEASRRQPGSSPARRCRCRAMVTSAMFGLPSPTPAPVGFESARSIVSSFSSKVSLTSRMRNVFEVSPGAKLSEPSAIS